MSLFNKLLDGLNDHLLEYNSWPTVKISPTFWEEHANEIASLHKEGIQFEVEESLRGKFCFVIGRSPMISINERAQDELKSYINWLVSEAKGDEPILNMASGYLHFCSN